MLSLIKVFLCFLALLTPKNFCMVTHEDYMADRTLTHINRNFKRAFPPTPNSKGTRTTITSQEPFSTLPDFLHYFYKEAGVVERNLLSSSLENVAVRTGNHDYLAFALNNGIGKEPFAFAEQCIDEGRMDLLNGVIVNLNEMHYKPFRGGDFGSREDLLVHAVISDNLAVTETMISETFLLIGAPYDLDDYFDDETGTVDRDRLEALDIDPTRDEKPGTVQFHELQYALTFAKSRGMLDLLVGKGAKVTPNFIQSFPQFVMDPVALLNLKRYCFSLIPFQPSDLIDEIFDFSLLEELLVPLAEESRQENEAIVLVAAAIMTTETGLQVLLKVGFSHLSLERQRFEQ